MRPPTGSNRRHDLRKDRPREDSLWPGRLLLIGGGLLLAAWGVWAARELGPSLVAARMQATAELVATSERDDSRVNRAFARAQQHRKVDANVEPLPSQMRARHNQLSVRAASSDAALAELQAFSDALKAAFDSEGAGELLVWLSRKTTYVPDERTASVGRTLRWSALALALAGAASIGMAWTLWRRATTGKARTEVPLEILAAVAATALFVAARSSATVAVTVIVMPIPLAIAVMAVLRSLQTRRAARWSVGRARILRSETTVERRHFTGDATKVVNVPAIEYEFSVGREKHRGSQVSISDTVDLDSTLQRYPVGAEVPVFYEPADPKNCVLEREAPMAEKWIWLVAGGGLAVGATLVYVILHLSALEDRLAPLLPPGGRPLLALMSTGFGLFMLLFFLVEWRQASLAAGWPVADGRVVSSGTESTQTLANRQRVTLHRAVIEYSYRANGREYHSGRTSFGADVSGAEGAAKARAARYPVGAAVVVHYDPSNPSNAVIETHATLNWLLAVLGVLFLGAAVHFAGFLSFPGLMR